MNNSPIRATQNETLEKESRAVNNIALLSGPVVLRKACRIVGQLLNLACQQENKSGRKWAGGRQPQMRLLSVCICAIELLLVNIKRVL